MHFLMRNRYQGKVGPWKNIESSLYHQKQSPKLGFLYPKTCEIAIARRTPEKQPHARTSHTCERARTCAYLISQLTVFNQSQNSRPVENTDLFCDRLIETIVEG
jgi:hypothetical protein